MKNASAPVKHFCDYWQNVTLRCLNFSAIILFSIACSFSVTILLTACEEESAAYKRGVESAERAASARIEQASQESYKKGYNKGYMDAFAAKFPGSGAERPKWVQALQGVIGLLAALKIVVVLIYADVRLIFFTRYDQHIFGRVLMGVIGTLGVFWLAHSAGIFDDIGIGGVIKSILFYPIPYFLGHLAIIVPSALFGFWMLRFLMYLHKHTSSSYVAAFHVLWLSAAIAIYIPLTASVLQLPAFGQFVVFDVLAGWLLGAIFYTARKLLDYVPLLNPPPNA
jgi:hypothetical protein